MSLDSKIREKSYEQTRQLTAPKARHGLVAILSAQGSAESACLVG